MSGVGVPCVGTVSCVSMSVRVQVQEEDGLVVCAKKSQRIRSIDLLSDRLKDLTSRVAAEGKGDVVAG